MSSSGFKFPQPRKSYQAAPKDPIEHLNEEYRTKYLIHNPIIRSILAISLRPTDLIGKKKEILRYDDDIENIKSKIKPDLIAAVKKAQIELDSKNIQDECKTSKAIFEISSIKI